MFPMEIPTCRLTPFFANDFKRIPPDHIFACGQGSDLLTAAPNACGATEATRRDFRLRGADRELQARRYREDYDVWPLSERQRR